MSVASLLTVPSDGSDVPTARTVVEILSNRFKPGYYTLFPFFSV